MKCALGLSPKSITPALRSNNAVRELVVGPRRPPRDGWRGSFRGYFRRDRDARARQFMTQSVTSSPLIAALRKVHSIISSAVASIVDGTFKPGAFAAIVSRLAIMCPFSDPNIRVVVQSARQANRQ